MAKVFAFRSVHLVCHRGSWLLSDIMGKLIFLFLWLIIARADNLFVQSGGDMFDTDPILSAEVVLLPASGRAIREEAITAENIASMAPPADAIKRTMQFFADAGFVVGSVTGISFSITAPRGVFERIFKVKVEVASRSTARVLTPNGALGIEFPLDVLPGGIRSLVTAVTFSQPLDFGPTGNFNQ